MLKLSIEEATQIEDLTVPTSFICPITRNIMARPVFLVDGALPDDSNLGHVYEEAGRKTFPSLYLTPMSLQAISQSKQQVILEYCAN